LLFSLKEIRESEKETDHQEKEGAFFFLMSMMSLCFFDALFFLTIRMLHTVFLKYKSSSFSFLYTFLFFLNYYYYYLINELSTNG
jgi:uncharacterized RDD family membrane protein YckC